MNIELWELGIAIGGILVLKSVDWKLLNLQIKSLIKPVEEKIDFSIETQEEFKSMLLDHNKRLERYSNNEAFYREVEAEFENGMSYLTGEYKACAYLTLVCQMVKQFSKDILLIGINKVKDDVVINKASVHQSTARMKCRELFGDNFSNEYFNKYRSSTKSLVSKVCKISDESWVNNKNKKFFIIMLDYTQMLVNNFVKFYYKYNNIKPGDNDET